MEVRFKNTCTQNPQTLTELARHTGGRWSWLFVVLPIAAAAAGVIITVKSGFGFTAGLFFLAALMILSVLMSAPKRAAAQVVERNRKQYGEDIAVTLDFFDDGIKAMNHQMQTRADAQYSDIIRLIETKSLYLLMVKRGMALMVAKDGFSLGKEKDFPAFIMEKTGLKF